jgi:hypothetical protein
MSALANAKLNAQDRKEINKHTEKVNTKGETFEKAEKNKEGRHKART